MKRTKQIFSSVFAVMILIGGCVGVAVGYNGLSRQIDELTKQVEILSTENKTLSDKTTDLETANKSLTDKTTELEEENKSLSNKVALLATEVNVEILWDGILKTEFIEKNLTYGAYEYYNKEEDEWISAGNTESLPRTRTYVIKDEEKLNEACTTPFEIPLEIDFEKEMLLIHFYADMCIRGRYFKKVKIGEDNILRIEFDYLPPEEPFSGDASNPHQKVLIVKINKLDVNAVEFENDYWYIKFIAGELI